MKQHNITLDTEKIVHVPFVQVSQADKNVHTLVIAVQKNEVDFDLSGLTVECYIKKPSGTITHQITTAANVITLTLDERTANEKGKCTIELHVKDGVKRLALMQVRYHVIDSISLEFDDLAKELPLWQQMMSRLEALENKQGKYNYVWDEGLKEEVRYYSKNGAMSTQRKINNVWVDI